jgi:hypothetical protein
MGSVATALLNATHETVLPWAFKSLFGLGGLTGWGEDC